MLYFILPIAILLLSGCAPLITGAEIAAEDIGKQLIIAEAAHLEGPNAPAKPPQPTGANGPHKP